MTVIHATTNTALIDSIRRIAVLEYALIETCNDAAEHATDYERALLVTRVGTAQVHLFDLGTALRELGDESLNYSRCMRQALLERGTHDQVLARVESAYLNLVRRNGIPEGLRVLLRANVADHRGLDVCTQGAVAWAA